jgi:hypothetical protein
LALISDTLYSASFDGSIKKWTVIRGVELTSYKVFDDSIISVLNQLPVYAVSLSNFLVKFSFVDKNILSLKQFSNVVLGSLKYEDLYYVAMKNSTNLIVEKGLFSDFDEPVSSSMAEIKKSCSSVFIFGPEFLFVFAIRDGSFLSFSAKTQNFTLMVNPK